MKIYNAPAGVPGREDANGRERAIGGGSSQALSWSTASRSCPTFGK